MRPREPTIFVLNIAGTADFAFEACDLAQAEELARSPRFRHAIGNLCSGQDIPAGPLARRIRAATANEASLYRDSACEFDDRPDGLFIMRLAASVR